MLHGEVLKISPGAIVRDKPAEEIRSSTARIGGLGDSSQPEGQEPLCAARVSLDREQMPVDDKLVNLPGTTVTVEIKRDRVG